MLQAIDLKDYAVRYNAAQLFRTLTVNRLTTVQQGILTNVMGVPKLVDLLRDTREVVRNGMKNYFQFFSPFSFFFLF